MNIFKEESQDINGFKSWIIRFCSGKIPFMLRSLVNDVSHMTYISVYRNTRTCKVILLGNIDYELHIWDEKNHILKRHSLKKLRCRKINWHYFRGYNRKCFFIYFIYHKSVQRCFNCTIVKGWRDTSNGQFMETTYNAVIIVDIVLHISRTLHLCA